MFYSSADSLTKWAQVPAQRKTYGKSEYVLTPDDIRADLTLGKGRPQWIFSAYGPGKNMPIQLFGGPEREKSFEEMRAIHYDAIITRTTDKAIEDANNLYAAAENQIHAILNDIEGAIKYLINGTNQHPNRIDFIDGKGMHHSGPPAPAASSQWTTPFRQPTQAIDGFGKPSVPGQQQQQQQIAFGQAASGPPIFGRPSAISQTTSDTSAPAAFGQISTTTQTVSQEQLDCVKINTISPFTRVSNQSHSYRQLQRPIQGQFGTGVATGTLEPSQMKNPFRQPSSTLIPSTPISSGDPQAHTNIFSSQSPMFGRETTTARPTHQLSSPVPPPSTIISANIITLNPLPKLTGETQHDPMTNKLLVWKGQVVKYIDDEPCYQHPDNPTTFVHIFFPDGAPTPDAFKSSIGTPGEYTSGIETAYSYSKEHGAFKNGLMPLVPPKPEWCSFDL
ncbi:hypothetical protein LOZ61_006864 [Ophidiomyces ophidiicola]|nr:hypothetical protein LOZ61_006864 [Ophidiomyces ophidiicola]KAI1919571.1 hypothetical protein LOZ60_006822 [Ophidiomyces ophidiicola]KAI1945992.1 hypothetical protein LOZ59_006832 [Ophidiomyces ophidiicola]KAI2115264.1 hypothetical protein LOZ31_006809 [Ophidiomyces ophidiicola]KAI2133806.1 hypothetical protein LOZ27_006856 [Ophidiomyces ophidiicola]